jgi:uroporphyrinogen-III decarboxylase
MNVKERFNRTCNFEIPDQVVTYDLIKNTKLFKVYSGNDKDIVVKNATMMKAIGLNSTRTIYNPEHFYAKRKLDVWKQLFDIKPDGWETKANEYTSWFSKRPFSKLSELEKFLPQKPKKEDVQMWYKNRFRRIIEVFEEFDLVFVTAVEGPFTDAQYYTDFGLFFEAMFDAPEIINYLLDVFMTIQNAIAEIHSQNPTSPVFFICDDIAYNDGIMMSKNWIAENLIPRWKYIYEPIRKAGQKCCFHSDGNLNKVLDLLIDDLKIDGLNPIEPKAGMDIKDIRNKYKKLLLFGNISCSDTLPFGSTEDVRKETKNLLKYIAPSGGLLLGSSSEVSKEVPVENVLEMYNTVQEYGKYPINLNKLKEN